MKRLWQVLQTCHSTHGSKVTHNPWRTHQVAYKNRGWFSSSFVLNIQLYILSGLSCREIKLFTIRRRTKNSRFCHSPVSHLAGAWLWTSVRGQLRTRLCEDIYKHSTHNTFNGAGICFRGNPNNYIHLAVRLFISQCVYLHVVLIIMRIVYL